VTCSSWVYVYNLFYLSIWYQEEWPGPCLQVKTRPNINRAQYRKKKWICYLATIANYYIVCWDAVRSVATGWLLVKHNSVFICFLIIQSYPYWPCDVLPHFPVLVKSLTRCAPAISSFSHFAHGKCRSTSRGPRDVLLHFPVFFISPMRYAVQPYFEVRVNSSVWLCSDIFRRFKFNSCVADRT